MIRLKIKRVFNNNVVLVYKDDDEAVIFGKGIGFQKKHGDTLDETKIGKIFTTNKTQSSNFETLFNEISTEYVDLTYKIVEQAESDLNIEFNSSIYIAVMDHINYALVRAQDNLFIKNDLIWEIQRTYPNEYKAALNTLSIIKKDTGIELPVDEAGTLAIHYFNAEDHKNHLDNSLKAADIIQGIVKIIQFYFKIEFDQTDMNYNRLMTHLRFFINSLLSNEKRNENDDEYLFNQMVIKYPDIYDCTLNIRKYIMNKLNKEVKNEELLYLMIHINRIIEKEKIKKETSIHE